MGECGSVFTRTWVKRTRSINFTADILDTVQTIKFFNAWKPRDTIVVRR